MRSDETELFGRVRRPQRWKEQNVYNNMQEALEDWLGDKLWTRKQK